MQTDYNAMTPYIDGQVLDGRPSVTESPVAFEAIPFGRGVVNANASDSVRTPRRNTATIVFSADLVTSNTINGKVNGTAIAQVTFSSNHLTTMGLLETAVETVLTALGITGTATVGGASNRTLTIVAQDASILFADWVVAAGGSQATVTHAYTTADVFRGIATQVQKQQNAAGVAQYEATEIVSCGRRGLYAVRARGGAMTKDADVYLCLATAGDEGGFTATSTGNIGPVGKSRSACADDALFALELNMP